MSRESRVGMGKGSGCDEVIEDLKIESQEGFFFGDECVSKLYNLQKKSPSSSNPKPSIHYSLFTRSARMVELVDTQDLKSCGQ